MASASATCCAGERIQRGAASAASGGVSAAAKRPCCAACCALLVRRVEAGDGSGGAPFGDELFEQRAAGRQRQRQGELAVGKEQIEGHEDDGDLRAQGVRDDLAADALAHDRERQRLARAIRCRCSEVPAEDFAVENQRLGDVREGFGKLGKLCVMSSRLRE